MLAMLMSFSCLTFCGLGGKKKEMVELFISLKLKLRLNVAQFSHFPFSYDGELHPQSSL